MQQLSALDASFLYLETPNTPMHIGGVAIYDRSTSNRELTYQNLTEFFEQRLHLARTFRQRAVTVPLNFDHPYWVEDPNFDLEYHVRHIALPPPGGWRQLCDMAARIHSHALDTTRPLWELWVIEGLNDIPGVPAGSYAVVSKIHHAAIDGVSGAEITAAIHDLEPDAEPTPQFGNSFGKEPLFLRVGG